MEQEEKCYEKNAEEWKQKQAEKRQLEKRFSSPGSTIRGSIRHHGESSVLL